MNSSKRTTTLCVAATILVAAVATKTVAANQLERTTETFDLVPPATQFVIVIPNVENLSKKLAIVEQEMKLDNPDLRDALASLKREIKLGDGMQDDGALAVTVTNVNLLGGGDPVVLIFAPVDDYDAFIQNYSGIKGKDITPLALPGGESGFAKKVGNHALIAETKGQIEAYEQPNAGAEWLKRAGDLGKHHLPQHDAMIFINMPLVSPVIAAPMAGGLAMGKAGLAQEAKLPPDTLALANYVIDKVTRSATAVIRDTQSIVIGFDIHDAGIGITATSQFKPDSPLARMFTGAKPVKNMLARVPDEPFTYAIEANIQGMNLDPMFDALAQGVPANAKWISDIVNVSHDSMKHMGAVGEALYLGDNAANQIAPPTISVYEVKDEKAYLDTVEQAIEALDQFKITLPTQDFVPAPDDADEHAANVIEMSFDATFKTNAFKVGDLQAHAFEMKLVVPEHIANEPGAEMLNQPMTGYLTFDQGRAVVVENLHRSELAHAVKTARANKGLANNKAIKQIPDHALTTDPSIVVYANVRNILLTPQFAMFTQNVDIPTEMTPIAESMTARDGGVAVRSYIGFDTARVSLNVIKSAVEQIMNEALEGIQIEPIEPFDPEQPEPQLQPEPQPIN